MAGDLWAQVDALRAEGGFPVIRIPLTAVVRRPVRPPGRPRARERFAGWTLRTPTGRPMRCRRTGCRKQLSKDAVTLVCSPACEEALRRYCEATLAVLTGALPAAEYPMYFRAEREPTHRKKKRRQGTEK